MQDISVTFYEVSQCGYYKSNQEHQFGELSGTLSALRTWASGKRLENTLLVHGNEDDGTEPTYLYSLIESAGEYLLCTWNQVESTGDEIATVHGNELVGTASVSAKSVEPGTIPGYATYFWFIPGEGIFATIRFQHRKNGQRNMQRYIENYLHWFGPHVVIDRSAHNEVNILGYTSAPGGAVAPQKVTPRFRTSLSKRSGEIDMLRSNRTLIRKVIRRTTLDLNNQPDRAFWQKAIEFMTIRQQPAALNIPIEYSAEVTPTLDELNAMYEDLQSHVVDNEWGDYGFVLEGSAAKTHWLGRGKVTGSFQVNVRRKNIEIVDLAELLRELQRQRQTILQLRS